MADAVISYTDEDTGTVFRWHGGAYIDVGYLPPADGSSTYPFVALDVINVWNIGGSGGLPEWSDLEIAAGKGDPADRGTARPFRRVLELFEERCQQYMTDAYAEQGDDETGSASVYGLALGALIMGGLYLASHVGAWLLKMAEGVTP